MAENETKRIYKRIISNCIMCPNAHDVFPWRGTWWCMAAKRTVDDPEGPIPDWCPLETADTEQRTL